MLIIPQKRIINCANDIKELKELKRNIIIYTDSNQSIINECANNGSIAIVNISVQDGNAGGVQSKNELLYTINSYYGNIIGQIIALDPSGKPVLNKDCEIRIIQYSFAIKLINRFTGISNTVNSYSGMFRNQFAAYENKFSDGSRIITPSDPRYYNMDHQLLVTDMDDPYLAEYGEVMIDRIAKEGDGVGYRLRDLIDPNTNIKISKIKISDPFSMIKQNIKLSYFINKTVLIIENYAMLTLAKSYTVILDKENGFNVLNLRRSFNKMNKEDERFQIAQFYETVHNQYEELKESDYNIRITLVYNDFQSNISVLPTSSKNILMQAEMPDIQSNKYMEEFYLDSEMI